MRLFFLFLSSFLIPSFLFAQVEEIKEKIVKSPLVLEFEMENGGILQQKGLKNTTYEGAYYNGLNLKVGFKSRAKRDQYYQV